MDAGPQDINIWDMVAWVFSSFFPQSIDWKQIGTGLLEITVGVSGCLHLYVGPVIHSRFLTNDSLDGLPLPQWPSRGWTYRKWID